MISSIEITFPENPKLERIFLPYNFNFSFTDKTVHIEHQNKIYRISNYTIEKIDTKQFHKILFYGYMNRKNGYVKVYIKIIFDWNVLKP